MATMAPSDRLRSSSKSADILSHAAAGASRCEELQNDVSGLAATVEQYRGALGNLASASEVDSKALRSQFDLLVERGCKIRADVAKLAALAECELPQWTDEASLLSILAQWQSQFRRKQSQYARDIYLRVAADLSAARVEHPSLRIRQALEQLLQESIGHLYELVERVEMPAPPRLFHEPRWWNAIQCGRVSFDERVTEVLPCSASLAELLCELPRLRFVDEPPPADAAQPPAAECETQCELPAGVSAGEENPPPPSDAEASADSEEPIVTHRESAPAAVSPASSAIFLYGAPRCDRCGIGSHEITPSRMRLIEMPWRLLRKRYYRCRICSHRFLHWV